MLVLKTAAGYSGSYWAVNSLKRRPSACLRTLRFSGQSPALSANTSVSSATDSSGPKQRDGGNTEIALQALIRGTPGLSARSGGQAGGVEGECCRVMRCSLRSWPGSSLGGSAQL